MSKTKEELEKGDEKKSLFGGEASKGGLFGDLNKPNDKAKLFQDKGEGNLFSNSGIFSGNSIFGNKSLSGEKKDDDGKAEEKSSSPKKVSLFPDSKPSIFSDNKPSIFGNATEKSSLFSGAPLFSFNNTGASSFMTSRKKSDDEEDGDGEDGNELFEGSNSPNAYNPVDNPLEKEKSNYTKKYVKQIENVFVYNKTENKFVSKGNGYLSIEHPNDDQKLCFIVFRYYFLY
jgi:hypothetical protein